MESTEKREARTFVSRMAIVVEIKEFDLREDLYYSVPQGGVGCELGVCRGHNAVSLYHAIKPSKFYLVDFWGEMTRNNRGATLAWHANDYYNKIESEIFREEVKRGIVELYRGGSLEFLRSLSDGSLDWVYIDTGHHYDQTLKELNLSLKKVKVGGYIMGHDFVTGFAWRAGVVRSVIEKVQGREARNRSGYRRSILHLLGSRLARSGWGIVQRGLAQTGRASGCDRYVGNGWKVGGSNPSSSA